MLCEIIVSFFKVEKLGCLHKKIQSKFVAYVCSRPDEAFSLIKPLHMFIFTDVVYIAANVEEVLIENFHTKSRAEFTLNKMYKMNGQR